MIELEAIEAANLAFQWSFKSVTFESCENCQVKSQFQCQPHLDCFVLAFHPPPSLRTGIILWRSIAPLVFPESTIWSRGNISDGPYTLIRNKISENKLAKFWSLEDEWWNDFNPPPQHTHTTSHTHTHKSFASCKALNALVFMKLLRYNAWANCSSEGNINVTMKWRVKRSWATRH